MKLHIISIIPIELYTCSRRKLIEEKLLGNRIIYPTEHRIKSIFCEIGGDSASVFDLSPVYLESTFIAFHESSLCICINKVVDEWILDHTSISSALEKRKNYHASIINNGGASPVYSFISEIQGLLPKNEYGEISPLYVFSFYVIENNQNDAVDKNEIMKFVEPSAIDMDDMLSTECDSSSAQEKLKQSAIDGMADVDISNTSETYISWATIVSLSDSGESAKRSRDLLTVLEIRLQIVWNRCYSVSQYIENVLDDKIKTTDITELFWSFSRTLDDAKSVLSSTLSSRAARLFLEMGRTSKIEGEISRLDQKLSLLEKYIEQRNAMQSKKYQKTIELLLFVTALASLAHVFFPIPVDAFHENIEFGIMIVVAILGVYAIFKRK